MHTESTTHRGYMIRQYGQQAVVLDDHGRRQHTSPVIPARAAQHVAERAFHRDLSAMLSRLAIMA